MLKDGASHFKGREEATLRNIDAARKLFDTLKSSYGPNGMCKLVNNFIDKRFLTADGQTILSNLEVQHPAAKILAMASEMQNTEFGDGTLFVVMFAAELLSQAGELIQEGVHESFILKGYEMALAKCMELMEQEVVARIPLEQVTAADISTTEDASFAASNSDRVPSDNMIRPLVASKVTGVENVDKLCQLISEASRIALRSKSFNVDNVRVTKLTGGNFGTDSVAINGMVLLREPKTELKERANARTIILGTGIEPQTTEGTSTVLITKSDEMRSFTASEEQEMEGLIKHWSEDLKIGAVVCGGHISDLALHYLNKYQILAMSVSSKFDLKRLARVLGVTVLARLGGPASNSDAAANALGTSSAGAGRIMSEDIGLAEYIGVAEYGGRVVTIVKGKDSCVSTILLRGMSLVAMDEIERAVDDCVSLISASLKDDRFVAGGGHTEFSLSKKLQAYAATIDGIEQYGCQRFAQALQLFPSLLAQNAGQNSLDTIAKLNAKIKKQAPDARERFGVNLCCSTGEHVVRDMLQSVAEQQTAAAEAQVSSTMFEELGYAVYDHYLTKEWAIRLATDAALTLLRVDQIIMSKPAGGPKMQSQGHWDAADDRQPAF